MPYDGPFHLLLAGVVLFFACGRVFSQSPDVPSSPPHIIRAEGITLTERIPPPPGFQRVDAAQGTWAAWLRAIPLKPDGSPVLLWDGRVKARQVHAAVLAVPILKEDLIQCADAVMKLRAEWLYASGRFDDMSFRITNGMEVPFRAYANGFWVRVKGSTTEWVEGGPKGNGRDVLETWLRFIYSYAGTLSLSRELVTADPRDIRIGDCFIQGGSPGHVVLVIDLAVEEPTGRKAMLLAQSYMPAQEIHVLKRPGSDSPWYPVGDAVLETPEWTFNRASLKRFP